MLFNCIHVQLSFSWKHLHLYTRCYRITFLFASYNERQCKMQCSSVISFISIYPSHYYAAVDCWLRWCWWFVRIQWWACSFLCFLCLVRRVFFTNFLLKCAYALRYLHILMLFKWVYYKKRCAVLLLLQALLARYNWVVVSHTWLLQ